MRCGGRWIDRSSSLVSSVVTAAHTSHCPAYVGLVGPNATHARMDSTPSSTVQYCSGKASALAVGGGSSSSESLVVVDVAWHLLLRGYSALRAPRQRGREGGREGGARGAARSLTTPTRPLLQTLMSLTPGFQCVHPRTLMPKLPASFSSPQDTLLLFPVLSIQPSIPMAT
jgi:hypothetical protein